MARTDDDTWDLANSVGATATMVAAARAAATRAAVIDDPFAEPLVRAVGLNFFTRVAAGELNLADAADDRGFDRMTDVFAARTRFFDNYFLEASGAGIRQVVIVASGLDSRAYRLPWPAGLTLYEIDQPEVIDFKARTLAELGADPTVEHRTVGIDLRRDWPTALRQAGFDADRPTAWSAEGLMIGFLPTDAQDRLLDHVTALSASGSRFAADYTEDVARFAPEQADLAARWRKHGVPIDVSELSYPGERTAVPDYLQAHGWQTATTTTADLLAAAGLPPLQDGDLQGENDAFVYVRATRR